LRVPLHPGINNVPGVPQRTIEGVGFSVIPLGENGDATSSFERKSMLRLCDELPGDSSSAITRPNGQVVEVPSPAVPPSNHRPYDRLVDRRDQQIVAMFFDEPLDL